MFDTTCTDSSSVAHITPTLKYGYTTSNSDTVVYGSSIHKHIHYCFVIYYYFDIDLYKEDRDKKQQKTLLISLLKKKFNDCFSGT